ncbi:MAG: hypothetical protein QHC90_25795 [Shinella sp.]|nr:hypothetical protein [Shinella sp.]
MPSTLDIKLSGEARAFLRLVKRCGGRFFLDTPLQRRLARECIAAGAMAYAPDDSRCVSLTGKGNAYLDRMMRAH